MAYLSLTSSIRTLKVNPAWKERIATDRIFNPNLMVCPAWNGRDTTGRNVCADSFVTKQAGCSNASDRVLVENELRPKYIEFVNLNAKGIQGGQQCKARSDVTCNAQTKQMAHAQAGQFGMETGFSQIYPNQFSCGSYQMK